MSCTALTDLTSPGKGGHQTRCLRGKDMHHITHKLVQVQPVILISLLPHFLLNNNLKKRTNTRTHA